MVGHQAIGPDFRFGLMSELGHELHVVAVIIVTEERLLPAIPPLCDMMRVTGNNQAAHPGHDSPPFLSF
jgi:hypothetical protein